MTIQALIVDDERLARLELRQALAEVNESMRAEDRITIIGEASSKAEVLAFLVVADNPRPDVIFLDISMQGGSGFEVLEEIDYDGERPINIVFVTAYDEYAVRAFTVNALDYVLKPIDPDRLALTMERLQKALQFSHHSGKDETNLLEIGAVGTEPQTRLPETPQKLTPEDVIFITLGKQRRFVPLAEIVCVTANDNYSDVWLKGGKRAMLLRTMSEWEEMLPEQVFLRVHRGTIINLDYVDMERPWEMVGTAAQVYLQGVTEPFAVSRRSLPSLRRMLKI